MASNKVYVTLLSQVSYLAGTLVLNHTLNRVGAKYPLVVMYTPNMPQEAMDAVRQQGIECIKMEPLLPKGWKNEDEARFRDTWTKIQAFSLAQFDHIVLLDSDLLIKQNIDDLFDMQIPNDWIAAVHVCACNPLKIKSYPADWIPANCAHTTVFTPDHLPPLNSPTSPRPHSQFNSGVVVLRPDPGTYNSILQFIDHKVNSADNLNQKYYFPDQDLLTEYFQGKWKPLPWYYNGLRTLREVHRPMWSDDVVRVVHYILAAKPWLRRVAENSSEDMEFVVVNRWWWMEYEALEKEMDQRGSLEGLKWLRTAVAPPLA